MLGTVVQYDNAKLDYRYASHCFWKRKTRGGLIKLSRKPKSRADDHACIPLFDRPRAGVRYILDISFRIKTKSHHIDFLLLSKDTKRIFKICEYSVNKNDAEQFARCKAVFVPDSDDYEYIGFRGGLLYGPFNFIIIQQLSVYEEQLEHENVRRRQDEMSDGINRLIGITESIRYEVVTNYMKERFVYWQNAKQNGETALDAKKRFFASLYTEDEKMRVMQRATSVLLKEFDRVCRKHNIDYWLDFGTLLGAVRHSGFVPWDDDMDVGMMRKDIVRLQQAVSGEDTFIKITEHYCADDFTNNVVRVRYLDDDIKVFIDIFIHDFMQTDNMQASWEEVKRYRRMFSDEMLKFRHIDDTPGLNREERLKIHNEEHARIITQRRDEYNKILDIRENSGNAVVWGIDNFDCFIVRNGGIQAYDRIFPLTEIEFDGVNCLAPARIADRLTELYGDIYTLPGDMDTHMHVSRSDEHYQRCVEVLKKYDI